MMFLPVFALLALVYAVLERVPACRRGDRAHAAGLRRRHRQVHILREQLRRLSMTGLGARR